VRIKINKSKFVAGCQCLKRLYLQVHDPELAAKPDGATEAIVEQGREVGLLARQLFPGGVEVRSDGGLGQAIRATLELVANAKVPAIFEGTFVHGVANGRDSLRPKFIGSTRWACVRTIKRDEPGDVAARRRW
jgi:hypothetical protein